MALFSDRDEALIHWCHGAAGVVFLYMLLFLRYKDNKYLTVPFFCTDFG